MHPGSCPQNLQLAHLAVSQLPSSSPQCPLFAVAPRMLSQSSAMTHGAELISSHELLAEWILSPSSLDSQDLSSLTPWMGSAGHDSPYPSLNTALLASQPYPRRVRISRLALVLIEALSSYIKLESRSP